MFAGIRGVERCDWQTLKKARSTIQMVWLSLREVILRPTHGKSPYSRHMDRRRSCRKELHRNNRWISLFLFMSVPCVVVVVISSMRLCMSVRMLCLINPLPWWYSCHAHWIALYGFYLSFDWLRLYHALGVSRNEVILSYKRWSVAKASGPVIRAVRSTFRRRTIKQIPGHLCTTAKAKGRPATGRLTPAFKWNFLRWCCFRIFLKKSLYYAFVANCKGEKQTNTQ